MGIAYYPRPNDGPLSITNSVDMFTEEFRTRWEEDIQYLRSLNVNAIRIYAVDPSKNHDAFFCALQEVGIYVLVELLADCANCNIGGFELAEPPTCYPPELKKRGQYIINEFSRYDNVVAFSAGNEVVLYSHQQKQNAPCQKKFLRDMRAYVDGCYSMTPGSLLPRMVPIGVVNLDGVIEQAQYYACHTDPTDMYESVEWYGVNSYRHCDGTAETIDDLVGWIALREEYATVNLPVPVMITEYGCRDPSFPTIGEFETQRTWLQVDALYSQDYQDVFAGGMVFEYSAEKRIVDTSSQGKPWPYNEFMKLNYGVGYFSPVDCNHENITCMYEPYPEFDLLAEKLSQVDVSYIPPLGLSLGGTTNDTTTTGAVPECPKEFPALSDFVWPSDDADMDDDDGAWYWSCRVAITESPTIVATITTDSPTGVPTTDGPKPSPTTMAPMSQTKPPSTITEAPVDGNGGAPPPSDPPTDDSQSASPRSFHGSVSGMTLLLAVLVFEAAQLLTIH
jgi:hypothetical protein